MRQVLLTAAMAIFLASGCATMNGPAASSAGKAGDKDAKTQLALNESVDSLGALPEAAIPQQSCGMILWTLEGKKPAPVFRFVSGKTGEIMLGGQIIELTLSSTGGASGFGVYENLSFTADSGVTVEVTSEFGAGFDGGSYVERGLIKVRDESGWSLVAPAAGIAGCR